MKWCLAVILFSMSVVAFTPAETNHVAWSLLYRVVANAHDDNVPAEGRVVLPEMRVDTWETFIGGVHEPGWSFEDKKCAFEWYLSTLGTKDCRDMTAGQKDFVIAAISQCRVLFYTNAVPHLQALALNPYGTYREYAIENAIQLGGVDDVMTSFVESIITNLNAFTRSQRGTACAEYSRKLTALTNCPSACCLRAGEMFYRNRFVDIAGVVGIDNGIVASFPDYAISSNRLQTINWAMAREDCFPRTRKYLAAITNLLHHAPQPLPQVTIGGGSE